MVYIDDQIPALLQCPVLPDYHDIDPVPSVATPVPGGWAQYITSPEYCVHVLFLKLGESLLSFCVVCF